MIDYVLGNEKIQKKIKRLEIGEYVDSNHHPIIWNKLNEKRRVWRVRGKKDRDLKEGYGIKRGGRNLKKG